MKQFPHWTSETLPVNGINIHLHRAGEKGPVVILCHGVTDHGLCWTRLAQALETDYRVIMYDARGHGLSGSPDTGYTVKDHAADLAGLIKALQLHRPSLIGHSMGAMTVATTAANHPELVGCAVLEDPPWKTDALCISLEEENLSQEEWRVKLHNFQSSGREQIILKGRADHPDWLEQEWGPWADSKQQVSLSVVQVLDSLAQPFENTAGKIACPVLLLTGDVSQGAITTPQAAQKAAGLIPHCRIAHIEGAGHSIRRERFEPFLAEVRAFLKSHAHRPA